MFRKSLILGALAVTAISNAQTTIFDTISPATPGYTTTGSSPRFMLGESFGLLSSGGAGWNVQTLSAGFFVFGNAAPQTFTNVVATYRFYNGTSSSTTATDPAFLNLVGTVAINLGTVTQTTANQAFFYNPVNISAANINFTDGEKAMDVAFTTNSTATDQIVMAMRDVAPVVGSTGTAGGGAAGFWRDADNNSVINISDARTLTATNLNPVLALTANPVPEPASMAVLGIGALALIRRRRSRKA
jgi:hypothetical protein